MRNRYHLNIGKEKEKEYYDNNKKGLQEQARNKYNSLSYDEKDINREYGGNWYRDMLECAKKYCKVKTIPL